MIDIICPEVSRYPLMTLATSDPNGYEAVRMSREEIRLLALSAGVGPLPQPATVNHGVLRCLRCEHAAHIGAQCQACSCLVGIRTAGLPRG